MTFSDRATGFTREHEHFVRIVDDERTTGIDEVRYRFVQCLCASFGKQVPQR